MTKSEQLAIIRAAVPACQIVEATTGDFVAVNFHLDGKIMSVQILKQPTIDRTIAAL